MSSARGSSDRLKYASPRLRTCTRSALRFARCASATSFSTWARDLMPSLNASTHIARYWGVPYTIGVSGVGEALGEGEPGGDGEVSTDACGPGEQPLRTKIRTRAPPRLRIKRSRTARDLGR